EEIEPNDDFSHANPVSLGDDFVGNVSSSSDVFDVDFVTFSAPAGTLLDATTVLGTLPDSLLVLFDAEGTGLASAVGFAGGPLARIDFEIPVSGTYFLGVLSLSGSPGSYTLQIRSCAGSVLPRVAAVSVSRGVFSGR